MVYFVKTLSEVLPCTSFLLVGRVCIFSFCTKFAFLKVQNIWFTIYLSFSNSVYYGHFDYDGRTVGFLAYPAFALVNIFMNEFHFMTLGRQRRCFP